MSCENKKNKKEKTIRLFDKGSWQRKLVRHYCSSPLVPIAPACSLNLHKKQSRLYAHNKKTLGVFSTNAHAVVVDATERAGNQVKRERERDAKKFTKKKKKEKAEQGELGETVHEFFVVATRHLVELAETQTKDNNKKV